MTSPLDQLRALMAQYAEQLRAAAVKGHWLAEEVRNPLDLNARDGMQTWLTARQARERQVALQREMKALLMQAAEDALGADDVEAIEELLACLASIQGQFQEAHEAVDAALGDYHDAQAEQAYKTRR